VFASCLVRPVFPVRESAVQACADAEDPCFPRDPSLLIEDLEVDVLCQLRIDGMHSSPGQLNRESFVVLHEEQPYPG
jgi:hypothetical protein